MHEPIKAVCSHAEERGTFKSPSTFSTLFEFNVVDRIDLNIIYNTGKKQQSLVLENS